MTMQDAEELLAPISADNPCGEDMAFSAEYDRIREARRGDDPTLDQGEWVTDLKVADWQAVYRDSTRLLSARTKDLQLAVWYSEASVRLYGFEGLAQGYRLVAALCERYWETLHPLVEDGDLEQRIGNLSWLLTHSIGWIKDIALTRAAQGSFSQIQFDTARIRQNNPDDHAAAIDGLQVQFHVLPKRQLRLFGGHRCQLPVGGVVRLQGDGRGVSGLVCFHAGLRFQVRATPQ